MAKLDELETRVAGLEKKVDDFFLRVKVLIWLTSGLLGAATFLGLSAGPLIRHEARSWWESQKGQLTSSLQDNLKQAQQVDADLKRDMGDARQVANHVAAQNHPAPSVTPAKTRTQRQIDAMKESLRRPMDHAYGTEAFVQDIGQLTDCVTVFIADLEAHDLGPSYTQRDTQAVYRQISDLANELRSRIALKDTQSTVSDRTWHSSGWFAQFQNGLSTLEGEHEQAGTLGDAKLDQWKSKFIDLRNGFMNYNGAWPDPVK